jgi:hypothetical protein
MQIELNRNSIREKWDVNWWRIEIYYVIMVLKRINKKKKNMKRHFPFLFTWE